MPKPVLDRPAASNLAIEGHLGDYLAAVSDRWLKIAPYANPGMLEMFRDRDRRPYRNMVRWAGWFASMYLIGAVQVLRVTAEEALRDHLRWFVSELLSLQAEDGYMGPWPQEYRLRNRAPNVHHPEDGISWDTSGHYYMMLGLMLWYEETGDPATLDAVTAMADAICRLYLGRPERRMVDTGHTEMNLAPVHAFALLYQKTAEGRYLDMARQLVDEEFSATDEAGNPLAGDYLNTGLAGVEFYQIPKPRWESLHPIMALAELYYISGDDRYREAFERHWWSILKGDRHNNGGFSTGEQATGNPYAQGAIESCCTITWIAYSVEMLRLTGNSIVADEVELSTLNSVTGMHSFTGRWSTYNTPMDGVRRASTQDITFQAREGTPELNCCSVNTARGFGLISDWALMRDESGPVVNYYGPCTMGVVLGDDLTVELHQETDYPRTGSVRLTVRPSHPARFGLKVRIPYWSQYTGAQLNGEPVRGVRAGSYLCIDRAWQAGDELELTLDMSLHFWVGEKECAGKVSIYRGPVLLTYDPRFNEMDPDEIPLLDAEKLEGRLVRANSWIEPMMLLEFEAGGEIVRLCDFGSAGEGGTPYRSWLPVENVGASPFSPSNPLRSGRPG
jgi:DUF1680 family protein